MKVISQLLNGEKILIEVPDATEVGAAVRTSVLSVNGVEVEINGGDEATADFYVASTGSVLSGALTLRSGMQLRTGPLGGGTGLVFVLDVGDHRLFGPVPPGLGLEGLSALLNDAGLEAGADGPIASPAGPVTWSSYRTHDVVLTAALPKGSYVLDVRRAFVQGQGKAPGVEVSGGTLTRSAPADSRHVVLEAHDFVVYGIPLPDTDIDVLVDSMSNVVVSRQ